MEKTKAFVRFTTNTMGVNLREVRSANPFPRGPIVHYPGAGWFGQAYAQFKVVMTTHNTSHLGEFFQTASDIVSSYGRLYYTLLEMPQAMTNLNTTWSEKIPAIPR